MRARRVGTRVGLLAVGLFFGTAADSLAATTVTPTSINFGTVRAGQSSLPTTVTVTVDAAEVNREVDFDISSGGVLFKRSGSSTCPTGQLPAGAQSCTQNIIFSPPSLIGSGTVAGALTVRFEPPGAGTPTTTVIPLSGTADGLLDDPKGTGGGGKKGKKCGKKGKGKRSASAAKKKGCKKRKK